ncbi:hypothetical protein L917_20285 [Phytophthora nicotianae]|uniref:Uncharacterized protein n=1 Tax=Phytophthora nicotianae TaxID=4792 RepID=W2K1J2_PHYNI|nr:hypothetical protein L917_20285 [Phytophthora nicotianae]
MMGKILAPLKEGALAKLSCRLFAQLLRSYPEPLPSQAAE